MNNFDQITIKAKELFGSLRFWIVTLTAVIAVLEKATTGEATMSNVLDIVKVYLGSVVIIGSADSIATKFSSK